MPLLPRGVLLNPGTLIVEARGGDRGLLNPNRRYEERRDHPHVYAVSAGLRRDIDVESRVRAAFGVFSIYRVLIDLTAVGTGLLLPLLELLVLFDNVGTGLLP